MIRLPRRGLFLGEMQVRTLLGSVAVGCLVLLSGCSTEGGAREALEKDGYTDVELKPDSGDSYTRTGNKNDSECTGTVSISPGLFSSGSVVRAECIHSSVAEAETDVAVPAAAT